MTSVSKNLDIDKSNDIVDKFGNTCHWTIKTEPIYIKSITCKKYGIENNNKDPKFKVIDNVRISEYKHFCKRLKTKFVRKSFCFLKKWKTMYRGHMLLVILMVQKLLERFMKKNCKRQIKQFRIEKVITKCEKVYVK